MTQFVQLHLLTFFPPSNPNRDDQGRPKTCVVGGVDRLRMSSQSVKRAVRTSKAFEQALAGHLGKRTARLGEELLKVLKDNKHDDASAMSHARAIAGVFGGVVSPSQSEDAGGAPEAAMGALAVDEAVRSEAVTDDQGKTPVGKGAGKKRAAKKEGETKTVDVTNPKQARITTLAYVSQEEWDKAIALASAAKPGSEPSVKAQDVLTKASPSVDVALWGRMFADPKAFEYRRDAAAQVSHAFTTSACKVDFDYYTALDDLAKREVEGGAGFLDTAYHGSGVYYQYVCVDVDQLLRNLGPGHEDLAKLALSSLVEGFATISPSGKKNAFAHNTRAAYVIAEVGSAQPRSLAQAFLRPVVGGDLMERSIEQLARHRARMDAGYGPCADDTVEFDVYRDLPTSKGDDALRRVPRVGDVGAFCADAVDRVSATALVEAA